MKPQQEVFGHNYSNLDNFGQAHGGYLMGDNYGIALESSVRGEDLPYSELLAYQYRNRNAEQTTF